MTNYEDFEKSLEETCTRIECGESRTYTLKAEYQIVKKINKMNFNRKMSFFEKLDSGWWFIGRIFNEWCYTMMNDGGRFFQYLQLDFVKLEEEIYYD